MGPGGGRAAIAHSRLAPSLFPLSPLCAPSITPRNRSRQIRHRCSPLVRGIKLLPPPTTFHLFTEVRTCTCSLPPWSDTPTRTLSSPLESFLPRGLDCALHSLCACNRLCASLILPFPPSVFLKASCCFRREPIDRRGASSL